MTTAQAVGAVSREASEWYSLDWRAINRNVRRLQVRIVKAVKERRWGKVRALQHLLTYSYSGKALAVRRVTENQGKKTPGVDREIWDTPEKKIQAVHELKRRGYQPQLSFAKNPADQLRCCNIVTAMILARDRVISVLLSKSRRIRTQWKWWVSLPKKVEVLEMS